MKTLAILTEHLHLPRLFAGASYRPAPAANPAIQQLLSLTDVCGQNRHQIEYNRSPLGFDEMMDVNLNTYHLLLQLDSEPLAWAAIKQAQRDLQFRSVAQGKDYALMVYHQLDDGQPKLNPRALEALQIIARIATSKETGDLPEAGAVRGFISRLDVRENKNIQDIVCLVKLDEATRQRTKVWPPIIPPFKREAV